MTPKLESRPSETDPLAQLDAELDAERRCECRCHQYPHPHGNAACTKLATHYVEAHVFGLCKHPRIVADPNVTADGDRAAYLCDDCLQAAIAHAQTQLAKLPQHAVCPPPPAGFGCTRPISTIDDYVPVRRPL